MVYHANVINLPLLIDLRSIVVMDLWVIKHNVLKKRGEGGWLNQGTNYFPRNNEKVSAQTGLCRFSAFCYKFLIIFLNNIFLFHLIFHEGLSGKGVYNPFALLIPLPFTLSCENEFLGNFSYEFLCFSWWE